jgi:hypothetical protein
MKISKNSLLAASVALLILGMNGSAVEAAGPTRSVEMRGALERTGVGRQTAAPVSRTSVTTKSDYAVCGRTLNSCMVSRRYFQLACGVPAFQKFEGMSAACASVLKTVGGDCAQAAAACSSPDDTDGYLPYSKYAGTAGTPSLSHYASEQKCDPGQWVDQVTVQWTPAYGRVTKLIFRCTPKSPGAVARTMTFGVPAIADTRSTTYYCGTGKLLSGMVFRAGAELDAAGPVCKRVASFDETATVPGLYGGTGGVRQDRHCPEDSHIVGAHVWMEIKGAATDNIAAVNLSCR